MANWKEVILYTDVDAANAQTASDDYQFVWVDGRNNNAARRVIIDSERAIVTSNIGITKPLKRAVLSNLIFNDESDKGTGIGRGKILLICYTYVNEESIESNPSPVMVYDKAQYMAKGYFTKDGVNYYYPIEDGVYTFGNNIVGSIESLTLDIPIDSADVREVRVYVAVADYSESYIPVTPYQLVTTSRIPRNQSTYSATISSIPSIIAASYDKDLAPRGDDITLTDGIPFIANAVNPLGYPSLPVTIWTLTLNNGNGVNYVNRFHRIDLFDEAGAHADGEDYLEDMDWDTENMANIRIMDSDLTTPLDVYHYPIDAVVKLHKVENASGEAVKATLLIGTDGSSAAIDIEALTAGADGNDITVEILPATTDALLILNEGEEALQWLEFVSADGVYHVSITVTKPAVYNATLDLALVTTDTNKHAITITLETEDTAGYPSVTTAEDIYDLLIAAIAPAGTLDGIIASVTKSEDWTAAYVVESSIATLNFFTSGGASCSVASNAVTLKIAYSTTTSAFITTALQAIAEIGATAFELIKASANTEPGSGVIALMAETHLAGGSGVPLVPPTRDVQTRMLSWIRIPHLPANGNKTIYLVRFESIPTGMEGRFIELIGSGSPTATQMLLTNFYKNVVLETPLRNEECLIIPRDTPPAEILNSSAQGLSYLNAANMFTGIPLLNVSVPIEITPIDEYGYSEEIDMGYTTTHTVKRNDNDVLSDFSEYELGIKVPKDITLFGWSQPPVSAGDGLQLIYVMDGTLVWVQREVSSTVDRIRVKTELDGTVLYQTSPIVDLKAQGLTPGDNPVFYCVSIRNRYSGNPLITIAVIYDNYVGVYKDAVMLEEIERDKDLRVRIYEPNPIYATASNMKYGFITGMYLNDSYDIINLMRYMPIYSTTGLGAHKAFTVNTAPAPVICYSNENVIIDTLSIERDNRPGRIQWGSYSGMPDQNEYPINEKIIRIAPMKSLMPTDEHNTILIWAENNVYRLALLGTRSTDCRVIKEMAGVGLVNRNCLAELYRGYAWVSDKGIMVLTDNGISNISDGIIDTSTVSRLLYDPIHNWLWAKASTGSYVFQLDEKTRWIYKGLHLPDDFLYCINDEHGWISYDDNVMYLHGTDASSGDNVTRILTRAIVLIKKLGRMKVIGNLVSAAYKFYVKLYSAKITDNTATSAEYTGYTNKKVSVPGASADYAQIDLLEIDNVTMIEFDNLDGR